VLLPRLRSDLVTALLAACDGALNGLSLQWSNEAALTVVMAAQGYPGAVEKGSEIRGIAAAEASNDVIVFHAGTKQDGERIVANGGRVLNVTGLGATISEAQAKAYEAVSRIDWPEGFCRRDIGWRAVEREQG
jgi:phosphoribosylamine--glycine ligase